MILVLQVVASENDQFCFSGCAYNKDIFMKRGINPLVFLNIQSHEGNCLFSFLAACQWWRVLISTKQKSHELLAQH